MKYVVNFFIFFFGLFMVVFALAADNKPTKMAWGNQPTTLEPYANASLFANNTVFHHIFETLFTLTEDKKIVPLLLESYEVKDPLNWLLTLKKKVYFHDGSLMVADDVIASLDRVYRQKIGNAARKILSEDISYKKINDRQVLLTTKKPRPNLSESLTWLFILSHKFTDQTEEDFNQNKGLIGTGPYRLVGQQSMKRFEFKAFENYHRKKPFLKHVVADVITDKKQRVNAFLNGEYALVDSINVEEMSYIRSMHPAKFAVSSGVKLYHMTLDQKRHTTPYVRDFNGKMMRPNPLKDWRVRRALSKAIDRQFLVDTLYAGSGATPAAQLVPNGFLGYKSQLKVEKQNLDEARRLLKEAGYSKGFRLTLHDKDARRPVLEAIAKMFSKIGIQADVETFPASVYFPRLLNGDFSLGLSFFQSHGLVADMINGLMIKDGQANSGGYSSKKLNDEYLAASALFDPDERIRKMGYIMEQGINDVALIPLYFINDIWAVRDDLAFVTGATNYTLAHYVVSN